MNNHFFDVKAALAHNDNMARTLHIQAEIMRYGAKFGHPEVVADADKLEQAARVYDSLSDEARAWIKQNGGDD